MSRRAQWRLSRGGAVASALALALGGTPLAVAPVEAAPAMDMPSVVPAAFTPGVNNGQILSMTQVGNTMVVAGSFTSVSPANSSTTMTRNRVFAFDATTGAISSGFAPVVNGNVEAVLPGPTAGTVYIGGNFTSVNGGAVNRLALLDLSTGSRVTTFNVGAGFNAPVEDLEIHGGRLFVGGLFAKAAGQNRTGLATMNPTTGALDNYVNITFAERHNNSGEGRTERVGVLSFDISPDGSQMVAVGNFRTAGGLPRVQIAKITLGATSASVDTTFNTTGYEPLCYSFAYDSTVRQTSYDPERLVLRGHGNWWGQQLAVRHDDALGGQRDGEAMCNRPGCLRRRGLDHGPGRDGDGRVHRRPPALDEQPAGERRGRTGRRASSRPRGPRPDDRRAAGLEPRTQPRGCRGLLDPCHRRGCLGRQ